MSGSEDDSHDEQPASHEARQLKADLHAAVHVPGMTEAQLFMCCQWALLAIPTDAGW